MCVYIIKKRAYVYIHVRGSCLDKYISIALGPLRQKFLAPPLAVGTPFAHHHNHHISLAGYCETILSPSSFMDLKNNNNNYYYYNYNYNKKQYKRKSS